MSERKKDLLACAAMLVLFVLFFSKILFTDKIIRAPDIINEFLWTVKSYSDMSFAEIFKLNLKAGWSMHVNSGISDGGGSISMQFLYLRNLLLHLLPIPANIAWFIVVQLFIGACGIYAYCRLIGCSPFAALFAGAVFALAPENATLINAGHVMKIATITFAPWGFYTLEKGFKTKRLFWFMATGFVLAYQFFNTHWQIAYYTCLGIGIYALIRSVLIITDAEARKAFPFPRLLGMNLVVMFFFLSTVAISLAPLAEWSKDTNRGVHSGANQGKGGLDREEAMLWSQPPEEVLTFIIPGFFGLSRQEAGENPSNIRSYYWGRMVFTQTTSYMGLLPWLLLPLPLIFRRDKYTLIAATAVFGGLLFAMGKYTPFYNLLYDYFPGINRFRVPKMMMFIMVDGLAVLAALGIECLKSPDVRGSARFRYYLSGVLALPLLLIALFGIEAGAKGVLMEKFADMLSQPTRYEQGAYLVAQRWNNLMLETGIAAGMAAASAALIWLYCRRGKGLILFSLSLLALYSVDVWRINDKFMFLVSAPATASRSTKTPLIEFLARDGEKFRTLPMTGGDPMQFASNKIPVFFTSNAVQQKRWQDYLDNFSISSPMADQMNLKYLIYGADQYQQEKLTLGDRFVPVFSSPDGSDVVLENRLVMPKAWIVSEAVRLASPEMTLNALRHPQFDPRNVAFIESQPPFQLTGGGAATVQKYENEMIEINATSAGNSLLVLGEKYYRGWKARIDGVEAPIIPVNYILRGVYLTPGNHKVEFIFDPLPFKIGKWLTLASFAIFVVFCLREWRQRGSSGC